MTIDCYFFVTTCNLFVIMQFFLKNAFIMYIYNTYIRRKIEFYESSNNYQFLPKKIFKKILKKG